MEYKTINVIVNKTRVGIVKDILKNFADKLNNMKVGSPKIGKMSGKILMSFKVSENYYHMILEKLTLNEVQIITNDPDAKKAIGKAKTQLEKSKQVARLGWNDVRKKKKFLTVEQIEKLAEAGRYKDILKVSKDTVNYNTTVVQKAKELLDETIEKAMNKAFDYGAKNKYDTEQYLIILLSIAGDTTLKSLKKEDLMFKAGELAIKLCSIQTSQLDKLIKIANNNNIVPILNFKALSVFTRIAFEEQEKYQDDLDIAVRDLNLRWLSMNYDVVEGKLEAYEVGHYKRMIDYVNENK